MTSTNPQAHPGSPEAWLEGVVGVGQRRQSNTGHHCNGSLQVAMRVEAP